jgi:hypothetical protein
MYANLALKAYMLYLGKKATTKKKKGIRILGGIRQPVLYGVDESQRNYEIRLHNNGDIGKGERTIDVVRGIEAAKACCECNNEGQQRDEGWSHYSEPTTKKPWPKPKPAPLPLKSGGYKR